MKFVDCHASISATDRSLLGKLKRIYRLDSWLFHKPRVKSWSLRKSSNSKTVSAYHYSCIEYDEVFRFSDQWKHHMRGCGTHWLVGWKISHHNTSSHGWRSWSREAVTFASDCWEIASVGNWLSQNSYLGILARSISVGEQSKSTSGVDSEATL